MGPFAHYQRELDGAILAALEQLDATLAVALGQQQAAVEHVTDRHAERQDRVEDLLVEVIHAINSLSDRVQGTEELTRAQNARFEQLSAAREARMEQLTEQLHARPYLTDDRLHPFRAAGVGEVFGFRVGARADGADDLARRDDVYPRLEDAFRGSNERVMELQRPYLSLVRDHAPVLDIGCGRGEFLELLAAEGITGTGVDSDRGMVTRCLALGLQVSLGSGIEHLNHFADGELGTVFSAQVIEHLPYGELIRLLGLAAQKLRSGGLFIAETVNPHRIASLKTFWVDPTHQHPLFPEVMLELAAIAGYSGAYVFAPGWSSWEAAITEAPSYALVATAS